MNEHFRRCSAAALPYVIVERRTKYADVHYDYIGLPSQADDMLANAAREITDGVRAIFERRANRKSSYRVNELVGTLCDLEIDAARQAAHEIFLLLKSHLVGLERPRYRQPARTASSSSA